MASTAEGTVPWPVMKITSASGWSDLVRWRMPSPSMSFITRSVITASKGDSSIIRAPSVPEVATRQRNPVRSRLSATVSAWA